MRIMRSYGQYCPIARASEILAERWTPIILRNILLGCRSFTEIVDYAPGLSRSLLTSRLRSLERAGVITITPNPAGRGSVYEPTDAGGDLWDVLTAIGTWGERWLELAPEHLDPGVVLWSWCHWCLDHDRLPDRRVVIRFEFPDQPHGRSRRLWLVLDGEQSEVCRTHPGFEEDMVVESESRALAEWHLGRVAWSAAVDAGRIKVHGPPGLVRMLPTWNRLSGFASVQPVAPAAS